MNYYSLHYSNAVHTNNTVAVKKKTIKEKPKKSIKPCETFLKNFVWRTIGDWGEKSGHISASVIYNHTKIAVVSYNVVWATVDMLGNCGLKGMKHISTSISGIRSVTNERYKISNSDKYTSYFSKEMNKRKISDQMIEAFFKGYMLKQNYSIAFTDRVNRGAKQYQKTDLSRHLNNKEFTTRRRTSGLASGHAGLCTSSIIARLQTEAFGGVSTFSAGWHNSQHPSLGDLSITQFVIWIPPNTSCFTDMAHTVNEHEGCPYEKLGKKVRMTPSVGFSNYLRNELIVADGTKVSKAKKY